MFAEASSPVSAVPSGMGVQAPSLPIPPVAPALFRSQFYSPPFMPWKKINFFIYNLKKF